MMMFVNMVVWAFAGLNGWILATGQGSALNAVALAVCIASGLYGLVVMSK